MSAAETRGSQTSSAGRGRRFLHLFSGLTIFGFGTGLQVLADVGLSPWDVLHQGISFNTPLSIGVAGIVVGFAVLAAWLPLRQRLGIGTVANVIVIGLMIDLTLAVVPDVTSLAVRWVVMVVGIVLVGLGSGIYIGARLGPGPRDGLMTGLAELTPLSIRLARTMVEGAALIGGWILGGRVGLGTVVFAVTIGPLVQFFLPIYDLGEPT